MTKSSSNGSGNGSGLFAFPQLPELFAFPQFSDLTGSFPLLQQTRANGGLPITPVMELARAQAKIVSKCSDEIAKFAKQRLDRDEEFLTEMASCEDWESLREVQGAWAAQVFKDYMEQAEGMMQLLRHAYADAAAAMTQTEQPAKKAKRAAKAEAEAD